MQELFELQARFRASLDAGIGGFKVNFGIQQGVAHNAYAPCKKFDESLWRSLDQLAELDLCPTCSWEEIMGRENYENHIGPLVPLRALVRNAEGVQENLRAPLTWDSIENLQQRITSLSYNFKKYEHLHDVLRVAVTDQRQELLNQLFVLDQDLQLNLVKHDLHETSELDPSAFWSLALIPPIRYHFTMGLVLGPYAVGPSLVSAPSWVVHGLIALNIELRLDDRCVTDHLELTHQPDHDAVTAVQALYDPHGEFNTLERTWNAVRSL